RASGLRFSRAAQRTVILQSVGNLWAVTASDIEGPTDLDGVGLCLRPRYLAVLSILAWPRSARTVCKSPVPFKMWRAFVRRNDFYAVIRGIESRLDDPELQQAV